MTRLPITAEQVWLNDTLATLVAHGGYEPFILNPIPIASSRYLPDPVRADAPSLHTLVRRLMLYAGLGDYEVRLTPGRGQPSPLDGPGGLWLARADEDQVEVGVDPARLEDIDDVLAQASRVVTRLWRDVRGLEADDPFEEARLIDVTQVYLGFGAFALNGSHLQISGRATQAGAERVSAMWGERRVGYLSPQAHGHLLAVQALTRGLSPADREALQRTLLPTQAACFQASLDELAQQIEASRALLGVPPPEQWSPPAPLARFTSDLPRAQLTEAPKVSAGRPVFRVMGKANSRPLLLALAMAFLPAILIGRVSGRPALAVAILGLTALIGWVRMRRMGHDTCSHCSSHLAPPVLRCPGCGGVIRGRIRHRSDRHEALARLSHPRSQPPEHSSQKLR